MKTTNERFLPTEEGQSVTIKKFVKSGENEYGAWHLYSVVTADGKEMSWFLKDSQKELVDPYMGKTIVVKMEAKISKDGKPYKILNVLGEAVLNSSTGAVVPLQPDIQKDPAAYAAYWEEQVSLLSRCIHTVLQARDLLKDFAPEDGTEGIFTPDVVQKLATTLYIEYKKRT